MLGRDGREPSRRSAMTARRPDIIDNSYTTVDFANGVRAMLDLSMFADGAENQEEIAAVGDEARLDVLIPEGAIVHSPARRLPQAQAGRARAVVRSIRRALDGGQPPRLDLLRTSELHRRGARRGPGRGHRARRPDGGRDRHRRRDQRARKPRRRDVRTRFLTSVALPHQGESPDRRMNTIPTEQVGIREDRR